MKNNAIGIAVIAALIATPALAADMAVKAPPPAPAPVYNWTGFYGGANAGWIGSNDPASNQAIPVPDAVLGTLAGVSEGLAALSTGSLAFGQKSGFVGGGQAGYNYQIKNSIVGIEADFQGISGLRASGSIAPPTTVVVGVPVTSNLTANENIQWLGTVRARLGILPTPTVLLYGTGGLAYGNVTASASLAQSGTNGFIGAGAGTLSQTREGWTAGAGAEWTFTTKWSAKLEYLHYDLGTGKFNWPANAGAFFAVPIYQNEATSVHFQGDIVRAGLNYKL